MDFFKQLFGESSVPEKAVDGRPVNVFTDERDVARALVSDLCGVSFKDVDVGKRYKTNKLGALCFVEPKDDDGGCYVEIRGKYRAVQDWQFDDAVIARAPIYAPTIQVACSDVTDHAVRYGEAMPGEQAFGMTILYIDQLGYARRMGLNREIRLNQIETLPEQRASGCEFYSCSWHEIQQALHKPDPEKRWRALFELVSFYCNVLHKGICQCGFVPDKLAIDVMTDGCENKVDLELRPLRSAHPPAAVPVNAVATNGLDESDIAIRRVDAILDAIESSLAFESDRDHRELLVMLTMKVLLAQSDDEMTRAFGDVGEEVREYYNCGKVIMKFVDQMLQRYLEAQALVLRNCGDNRVKEYVRLGLTSVSAARREFFVSVAGYCGLATDKI